MTPAFSINKWWRKRLHASEAIIINILTTKRGVVAIEELHSMAWYVLAAAALHAHPITLYSLQFINKLNNHIIKVRYINFSEVLPLVTHSTKGPIHYELSICPLYNYYFGKYSKEDLVCEFSIFHNGELDLFCTYIP